MHPQHLIDEETLMLVGLWRRHAGGMTGAGPLPFAGGAAEQPAITAAAFTVCDVAMAAIRRAFPPEA